jgi:hypothetical protein
MSWPEALPRNSIGVTTAVAAIAIRSKAIRSELGGEASLEISSNPWGLKPMRSESEGISMRTRFAPEI